MALSVSATTERWPVDGSFVISRGAKTYVDVVVCTVSDGVHSGRGEGTPIYYEGETAESCVAAIEAFAIAHTKFDRATLLTEMPKGAARNALDCALWDLECQQTGKTLSELSGLPKPGPLGTAVTISVDDPVVMEHNARVAAQSHHLLKLKLSGEGDRERVAAVHRGAPDARLIVDANESWDDVDIAAEAAALAEFGVELIEQPVSAGRDDLLANVRSPIPICADESCHTRRDVRRIAPFYDAINIKLDKAGGLTEAIQLADAADAAGLDIMVGCMLCTSLGIAPAFALAQRTRWADLDGPLLLADDRKDGLRYENGMIHAA